MKIIFEGKNISEILGNDFPVTSDELIFLNNRYGYDISIEDGNLIIKKGE